MIELSNIPRMSGGDGESSGVKWILFLGSLPNCATVQSVTTILLYPRPETLSMTTESV